MSTCVVLSLPEAEQHTVTHPILLRKMFLFYTKVLPKTGKYACIHVSVLVYVLQSSNHNKPRKETARNRHHVTETHFRARQVTVTVTVTVGAYFTYKGLCSNQ
jgi:hypothetical protein